LSRELGDLGFDVVTCDDSNSAIKLLETSNGFDVVLTDLRMPGLDGLEVTRRAKAAFPNVEVILMTGYASLDTAAEGMRLGAYDYIQKPFGSIDLVVTSINRALEKQSLAARTRDLEQHLAHSDRLAAIGQLAAGVAHEINNPAGFILANLTAMKPIISQIRRFIERLGATAQKAPEPQSEELYDLISSSEISRWLDECDDILSDNIDGIQRISAIVADLRTFARIDSDDVELVQLDEIVEAAINMTKNEIRHRARLVRNIEHVPPIAAHPGKLTQVLVNLLVNATQAMSDPASEKNRITVSVRQDRDFVYLVVEDNGVGMSPEVQRRVFEPFFTTKQRTTGTGLGLSLSAEIVRQHRGTLSAESHLTRGSRFEIRLPFDTGLTPRHLPHAKGPESERRRRRILVIDDEPLLLTACRRLLEPLHDVKLAHDGGEALAILEEDPNFDVLVCDLMMPGVDGPKFYEVLQTQAPKLTTRVLFTTGGAVTPQIKDFADDLGPDLLKKPFTSEQLHQALARKIAQASESESED
jgi:signal transduction histidine kinase